jgi:hypothetical protein
LYVLGEPDILRGEIALFEKHTNVINALCGQKAAYCSMKGSGVTKKALNTNGEKIAIFNT